MLLLNRYLETDPRPLDLATGDVVRVRTSAAPPRLPLLTERHGWTLIDHGVRSARVFVEIWSRTLERHVTPAPTDGLRLALLDARDGEPRAIDLVTGDAAMWRATVHSIAREATLAGFVPVQADVLGAALEGARWQWPPWLADRSLVVITCDGRVSGAAAVGLLRLASRDVRPHVVVRGATSALALSTRLVPLAASVHEGDLPRGTVAATRLADEAWARAERGDHGDGALAGARWAVLLAPDTDGEVKARAALARGLAAQGKTLEARATLDPAITRLDALSPASEVRVRAAAQSLSHAETAALRHDDRAIVDDVLRVLETCQDADDEVEAVGRVLAWLRTRVAAASMTVVVDEGGASRTLASVGLSAPSTRLPDHVLATGTATVPSVDASIPEGAWPVRFGGRVSGVLHARWAAGLAVRPVDVDVLLGMAAVAMGPLVHVATARQRPSSGAPIIPDLVGESDGMRRLRDDVVRAAQSPFPVLIEGESGSGKELVARALHRSSPRRDRRFSALNCAALADELAEAELFGHARGAFTGAIAERAGLFEEAHGGTLFLDEVSELSMRVQAKLLRVLQEAEVRRLGEAHVRRIDVRIIAATNRPLLAEAEAGRFRRDLRYRLDVVRLQIPPLRERLEDVPALVQHAWSALAQKTGSRAVLSPGALAALGRYDWPGNVRELQNVLAALIVSGPRRGMIPASHLPSGLARVAAATADRRTLAAARQDFEARYVRAVLARTSGRPTLAARELGVSRQGLAKLVARLGLAVSPAPSAPHTAV
ncbi:MAG: sigma 54-interacting transcriptional regulator [Acidobacteria bacterium]|nr:sigma 54-interacting transcriptional regulator [Acidobacteriota bacterium]